MEEELASLQARVDVLERQRGHMLELVDRLDAEISAVHSLHDGFVMPALLYLGGDALREQMLRWLEQLAQEQRDWIAEDGSGARELERLQYWQEVLRKREPWPRFHPGGWMSPRAPKDQRWPFG